MAPPHPSQPQESEQAEARSDQEQGFVTSHFDRQVSSESAFCYAEHTFGWAGVERERLLFNRKCIWNDRRRARAYLRQASARWRDGRPRSHCVRRAPMKPSPEEVERHDATHIPRRMLCKVCAEAVLQEDPHFKLGVDHRDDEILEVQMDHKEIRKGQRPF